MLEDEPHLGQPVSTRTNENMEKTQATVMQDGCIKTRLLAECLGVSEGKGQENFGKRFAEKEDLFKVCATLLNS